MMTPILEENQQRLVSTGDRGLCRLHPHHLFWMLATAFHARLGRLTRFFNDQGSLLLAIEVGVILALAAAAMTADRRQTLRALREREASLLESARRGVSAKEDRRSESTPPCEDPQ